MIHDRRHSERFPTKMKVVHGRSGPNFLGHTLNVSQNGLAIQSPDAFSYNFRICIELYIGHEIAKLDGIVVWALFDQNANNSKMGIKLSQNISHLIKPNLL